MYSEQHTSAATLTESAPMSAPRPETNFEKLTTALTAAMAGADPVGNSTLRAMLEQSGLIKNLQEWASPSSVKLRHPEDVPDVVFLDLSTGMGSEFVFAQELSKLRPSVHIIACTA